MIEYTNFIADTPVNERVLCPLMVVIKNDCMTLKEQHELSWSFIQYMIDNNPKYWRDDIPLDVNHFKWCLCFNDVQLFVNVSTSKHQKLQSRNLLFDICLIVNPRKVFDMVAPLSKSKGIKL